MLLACGARKQGAALDLFAGLEECMFMSWHGLSLSCIVPSLLEGPLAPQGRWGSLRGPCRRCGDVLAGARLRHVLLGEARASKSLSRSRATTAAAAAEAAAATNDKRQTTNQTTADRHRRQTTDDRRQTTDDGRRTTDDRRQRQQPQPQPQPQPQRKPQRQQQQLFLGSRCFESLGSRRGTCSRVHGGA